MVRVLATVALSLCVSVPVLAQSPEELKKGEPQLEEGLYVPSSRGLRETRFRAGDLRFEMLAGRRVDVMALVKDVKAGDAAATIYEKVNEVRERLYPKDEIILAIGNGSEGSAGHESIAGIAPVSLVKAYYWWNIYHGYNDYWWARWRSTTAVMFTEVLGTYYIYDSYGSSTWGSWKKRKTVYAGGAYSRTTYGPYAYRGFRGVCKSDESMADIVLYFFK